MSNPSDRIKKIGIILFFGCVSLIAVIGLLLPLRPKVSDVEKRELESFPAFSAKDVLNGDYFMGIDRWYADTFPFRESLLGVNSSFQQLYGLGEEELHGTPSQGDAIPDTPLAPTSPGTDSPDMTEVSSEPSSEETSVEDTSSPETDESSTPAESTAEDSSDEESGAENQTEVPSSEAPVEPTKEETQPAATPAPETAPPTQPTVPDPVPQAPQMVGTVYLKGNSAYSLYYFGLDTANAYIQTVNAFGDTLAGMANVYSVLAPTSIAIMLSTGEQQQLGCSDEQAAMNYIYSSMNGNVRTVPTFDTLMQHRSEYIYFRTDHHWTALGAYYAYRSFANVAGLTPHELSGFQTMEFPGFLGSYYSGSNQSPALGSAPDTVIAYVPNGTNEMYYYDSAMNGTKWRVVNDVSNYKTGVKYSCFAAGDNAYATIENPTITDGSACLIFKDSYGNPFITFLVDHYQTIYIVDPRYYSINVKDFVSTHHVKDVILLNNLETLSSTLVGQLQNNLP